MRDLERRYSRVLRLFYPAEYRRRRGTELTGTYLELAASDKRWPSMGDVTDLAVGGMRERVRGTGLADGFRLAGTLALLTTTALAAAWSLLEQRPLPASYDGPRYGPSVTLGLGVWAIWLLAAAVHVAAPGRPARLAIVGAVLGTVAVVPLSAATGQWRPALSVLLPQAALGLVALGGADHRPLWIRLTPFAAAAAAVPTVSNLLPSQEPFIYYSWTASQVLPAVGVGLLVVVILLGVGLAMRGDYRGGWALLVLSGPIGLLSSHILAGALDGGLYRTPNPTWASSAVVAIAIAIAWPALVALAITVRRRPVVPAGTGDRCATCGAPIQR